MSATTLAAWLACSWIYDPVSPGVFDKVYRINETVCGTKLIGKRLHVVMQGTENLPGWMADVDILPYAHPVLGHLHSGFWRNIPALLAQLLPDIQALLINTPNLEIEVEGHSKGAGEAVQLAGALHALNYPVVQVYLFACPNAGYADFANYMREIVPGVSYRNTPKYLKFLGDPVPVVPVLPHVPPYTHSIITAPPPILKRLLGVAWHKGALYIQGTALL